MSHRTYAASPTGGPPSYCPHPRPTRTLFPRRDREPAAEPLHSVLHCHFEITTEPPHSRPPTPPSPPTEKDVTPLSRIHTRESATAAGLPVFSFSLFCVFPVSPVHLRVSASARTLVVLLEGPAAPRPHTTLHHNCVPARLCPLPACSCVVHRNTPTPCCGASLS